MTDHSGRTGSWPRRRERPGDPLHRSPPRHEGERSVVGADSGHHVGTDRCAVQHAAVADPLPVPRLGARGAQQRERRMVPAVRGGVRVEPTLGRRVRIGQRVAVDGEVDRLSPPVIRGADRRGAADRRRARAVAVAARVAAHGDLIGERAVTRLGTEIDPVPSRRGEQMHEARRRVAREAAVALDGEQRHGIDETVRFSGDR